jgi:uncharacterized metal-binding protein YceD (DUF177 family)
MSDTTALRVADLSQTVATDFDLRPDAAVMQALAADLGLSGLRKLRFAGRIAAQGTRDWRLSGRLGATVVQTCVVTLDPVTTRIDTDVQRLFVAGLTDPQGDEAEMPEDDEIEALGAWIDPGAVMAEALALALPLYPRAKGAALGDAVFTTPGQAPMRDEDTRPFAGLSGLREALKKDE